MIDGAMVGVRHFHSSLDESFHMAVHAYRAVSAITDTPLHLRNNRYSRTK